MHDPAICEAVQLSTYMLPTVVYLYYRTLTSYASYAYVIMEDMGYRYKAYRYKVLENPKHDIRLLHLQPGQSGDPIEISLQPARLLEQAPVQASQRLTLKELRRTLTKGQWMAQSREGRFFFGDDKIPGTSWDHPNPDFPRHLYDPQASNPSDLQFEALSYAWGSPDDPTTEICVSETCSALSYGSIGILAVRHNLFEALQHLRRPDRVRVLWIDAICINQEDADEKSEQVRRMNRIYELAHQVIIWLGPSSDDSDLACLTLAYLGKQIITTPANALYPHPRASELEWASFTTRLPLSDAEFEAIHRLFLRPWFCRLWVWQETILADSRGRVLCGNSQIPWILFRNAVTRLTLYGNELPSIRLHTMFTMRELAGFQRSSPFHALTRATTLSQCEEPRDRIYALLGIATPEFSRAMTVDYSLPVAQIYKQAFIANVDVRRDLALLAHCSPLNRNYDSPSWVPDWTSQSNRPWLMDDHAASGRSEASVQFERPNCLVVQGVHCAKIKRVGAPCGCNELTATRRDVLQLLSIIRSWTPEAVDEGSYISQEPKNHAYILTLLQGGLQGFCNINNLEWTEAYKSFSDIISRHDDNDQSEATLDGVFVAELTNSCQGSCFFETEEGFYGLANPGLEPGMRI